MRMSYKKLWVLLIQKDISKATLRKDVGLSTGTMSKLNKGEEVALTVLMRLCDYLNCDIGDICEVLRGIVVHCVKMQSNKNRGSMDTIMILK